ncbi:hypothetical protein MUN38_00155 [Corynebacterium callunae]|nr:hypothetical protein [Corynebacterium callunae]
MKHIDWLKSLPGEPSITSAARESGIQKTTLMRQLDRGSISPENVIEIARAFEVNPVDALVATGWLNANEVKIVGVKAAIKYATNQEMYDEMMERVDPLATGNVEEANALFHGTENEITPHFSDNVAHLPSREEHEEPERYVAKKRNRELSEGDDGYGSGA